MRSKHYFKSLKISNYRGINNLTIDSLHRINILGGLNGAGKSTIIECLFYLLDVYNPISVVRSNLFRNAVIDFSSSMKNLFYTQDTSNNIKIQCDTENGKTELNLKYEKQPILSTNFTQLNAPQITTSFDQHGLTIEYKKNNTIIDIFHMIGASENINIRTEKNSVPNLPPGIFFNKYTMNSPIEMCERLSTTIRDKNKSKIIDYLKIVEPNIQDVAILSYGGQTHVSAVFENERYMPLSTTGGGASTFFNICLAIMNAPNGAVFLDEFDTAIHFSKLTTIWKIIDSLSHEYNCQVFTVSHSAECIHSAAKHFLSSSHETDFAYFRIDRHEKNIKSTKYDSKETIFAMKNEWEIR